jgi:poly-gamma-glutamate synthesis protein (capsule biosynthesis protein)
MKLKLSRCILLFVLFLLVSCRQAGALPTLAPQAAVLTTNAVAANDETSAATAVPSAATPVAPAPTAEQTVPVPTATPAPFRVGAVPGVPESLRAAAEAAVMASHGEFVWVGEGETDVTLSFGPGQPLATWTYAVVVPFATVSDSTTMADLQQNWQQGGSPTALMTAETAAFLTDLWGPGTADVVSATDLVAALWQRRPSWSLVPFHRLSPQLKVLSVDGISPLDKDFATAVYPLTVPVSLAGSDGPVAAFLSYWAGPESNRDPAQMTQVALTGVTALVRATAYQMEIRSILYPGEEVAPVLRDADIAHVSNEVSFVADCPYPSYVGDPVFCSSPRYMALLQDLGVDVVELTGNHLNDWGRGYLPYTIDLYAEAGMGWFGGGRDLAEATQPLLREHNGNRLAFVGCNPVGPFGAWATEAGAGAAPCDYNAFKAQIGELAEKGYLVFATQQYYEIYHYAPTAQQEADFRALADAGAVAVSGSQGHHAQGFAFAGDRFIHYGLGNLFFDQMDMMGTRQTFVDTYTIYDGRLLSVSLWTGLIENYARPRLMTPAERADLLRTVFEASGW